MIKKEILKDIEQRLIEKRFALGVCAHIPEKVIELQGQINVLEELLHDYI